MAESMRVRWPRHIESSAPAADAALSWVALCAVLLPIVMAVIRARIAGWLPIGDNAYFTVRSRDVLTSNHPLVGAWSSGSTQIGEWINNLGPLQLDLLAPFTKLSPYWGTAVGTAAINAGAVIGVWSVSRRLFGPVGVAAVAVATVGLEATFGTAALVDPSQQLALVFPFWCLLWLFVALAMGAMWALPWTALVASLVLQTHFTYAYQVVVLVLVTGAVLVWKIRDHWRARDTVRWFGITAGVVVACWAQPLWDQFFGTGNLGRVVGQSGGGSDDVGLGDGVRFVADAILEPLFWLPGTVSDFSPARSDISLWWACLIVTVWAAALVVVMVDAVRHRRDAIVALGVVSLAIMVVSVYATSAIPPASRYGIVAKNYFWLWPVGALLTITVVAGLVTSSTLVASRVRVAGPRALTAIAVVVSSVVPVVSHIPGWPDNVERADAAFDTGAELTAELRQRLDTLDVSGPVVIDLTRAHNLNSFEYTVLVELQRHGIEFGFEPGHNSIARFGRERCDDGAATHRLVLADGASARRRPGEITLASVDMRSRPDVAALTQLERRFGTLLRRHVVKVDTTPDAELTMLDELDMIELDRLADVLDHPGRRAADLAETMQVLNRFGRIELPRRLRGDLQRWRALDGELADKRVAVYLAPAIEPLDDCDSLNPGDLRVDWPDAAAPSPRAEPVHRPAVPLGHASLAGVS